MKRWSRFDGTVRNCPTHGPRANCHHHHLSFMGTGGWRCVLPNCPGWTTRYQNRYDRALVKLRQRVFDLPVPDKVWKALDDVLAAFRRRTRA